MGFELPSKQTIAPPELENKPESGSKREETQKKQTQRKMVRNNFKNKNVINANYTNQERNTSMPPLTLNFTEYLLLHRTRMLKQLKFYFLEVLRGRSFLYRSTEPAY